MHKFIFLSVTFLITFAHSAFVSMDKALLVSKNFYESKNENEILVSDVDIINRGSNATLYIVKLEPTGFIIVSANDSAMPILGYSFENDFIADGPAQFEWLLNQFSDEINILYQNNNPSSNVIQSKWQLYSSAINYEPTRGVQPLLSSNWDQGSPWNDTCPEDQDGPGGNALVGCVAIAMGQTMYYWEYPQVGLGDHAYNHQQYGYQYVNFQDAYYDYSSMADNYATDASALLLYHAGVSVNMGYGVDGSGAQVFGSNPSTFYAMRNYFQFKSTMQQVFPEDYSASVFRALLQEDLDNNRPIIYVGYDSGYGGHAWNVDGYDDDYFHCNWGWGGYQNGYFLLSAMNGFNSGQGAIINIEPQSLDVPNLVMTSSNAYEIMGDGDGMINPGETLGLDVTIENFLPWENAQNVVLILESNSEDITLSTEEVFVPYLTSGNSYSNSSNPFILNIPELASLGTKSLKLHVTAVGSGGEDFYDSFDIDISVSLNQLGFPIDSEGTVKSSPLVIDLDDDASNEIIYGDNNGVVHVLQQSGSVAFPGFPFSTDDQIWGSPASADIDLDGNLDFVISSKDGNIYVFDRFGLKWNYNTSKYLIGTPSIGNLDDDDQLEVCIGSYGPGSSENTVYAINHDGSILDGFPYQIDEKIKAGLSLGDFNNNNKDDIVFGTDDDNLYVISDSGGLIDGFPYTVSDKIQGSPSILDLGLEKLIFFGSKDDNFYSISSTGDLVFSYPTGGNIYTSPSFYVDTVNNQIYIFFGSDDGMVHAVDLDGNVVEGWPLSIGNDVIGSILFQDLDGDDVKEVIAVSSSSIVIKNISGNDYMYGSIASDLQITSPPSIADSDSDGDLEIIIGNSSGLLSVDIKDASIGSDSAVSMFKYNNMRNGLFYTNLGQVVGDLNSDTTLDILDIVQLINIVLGYQIPNNSQTWTADLNSDGIYNILDIVILSNLVLEN